MFTPVLMPRSAFRFLIAGGALLVGLAAPAARAQTTILPSSFSPGISVDGGRVHFIDAQAEFCTAQRARSMSVGGGVVLNNLSLTSGCPLDGRFIKADGSYVYCGTFNAIARYWAGGVDQGFDQMMLLPVGALLQKLDTQGDWVYWSTEAAVGRFDRDGMNHTQVARVTTFRPGMTAGADGLVYWVEGGAGAGRIMRTDLAAPAAILHAGGTLNSPSQLVSDSTHLYWAETNALIRRTTLAPGGAVETLRSAVTGFGVTGIVVDATHVYWAEGTASANSGRLVKVPKGGGMAQQIGPGTLNGPGSLQQDTDQLYWSEGPNRDIRRIRKDAAAITPDFSWLGLEVTQAIQNITNTVPIIKGKPTLVRGYSRSSIANYPNVRAALAGTRNGVPLPGSPLRPVVATATVRSDATITDSRRRSLGSTFNWELPDSWLAGGGTIVLTATINHDSSVFETGTANNTIVQNIQVHETTPICLKLRRTDTEAPIYEPAGPAFRAAIARFTTLIPARSVRIFPQSGLFQELSCCRWGIPPWYWGEWEVHEDPNKMIAQLIVEAITSVDFAQCLADLAPTHRMALVHPDANTGSRSGLGNYAVSVGWARMDGDYDGDNITTRFGEPYGGIVLAHEVAHNYNGLVFNGGILANRWKHVDCGDPDGINSNYPYATNTIGPVAPLNYYGYDPITRAVIAPSAASDFMSYCHPQWISDYNWRGLQEVLGIDPAEPLPPAAPGDYLFVIGFISPDNADAQVEQVIRIPSGSFPMSHITKLLNDQTARTSADPALRVELLSGAGAVIRSVNIDPGGMTHEDADIRSVFTAIVQDDPPAASVSVVRRSNNASLTSRGASPSAPVVGPITSPAAGQTYDATIPINWTASDPDGDLLSYIVQYSRDNGATWETLAANTPEPNIVLDASLLPGTFGNNGRIRVIASDGFNTGMGISAGFSIPNRDPFVVITEPANTARFTAGQAIRFRAGATDPEFGEISGSGSYLWSLTGPIISSTVGGPELILPAGLPPGSYSMSLQVFDAQFLAGADGIVFTVGDSVAPPDDIDGDGAPDASDNCPDIANASQADADGDGVGDECDNCPSVLNPDQGDKNGNGLGNACDIDRLYVNAAATGANTGLSWSDALTSLESALALCDTTPTIAEIWIARGRYVPTARTNPSDARSVTFRLRPGVSLRGGFLGGETSADNADPRANPTVLSGDIMNNDGPNFTNRTDNARTVLTSADGVNATVILDGLIISGGDAAGAPLPGGAILFTTDPTFRRCDFVANRGGATGGAVLTGGTGSATFDRCRFLGNAAPSGAGVTITGGTPQFLSCIFTGNAATGGAGAAARGGAVASFSAAPSFFNCTIAGNTSAGLVGGMHFETPAGLGTVVNSIVYFNSDSGGSGSDAQIRVQNSAVVNVNYCCVQGGFSGLNISDDPLFVDLDGADNTIGTPDDQPRPVVGSPVNDAGATPYASNLSFDADGRARFQDDLFRIDTGVGPAPIVDMGALERPAGVTCPADWNNDGVVNSSDISAFLTSWLNSITMSNLIADFNGDLIVNSTDISSFLTAWLAAVQNGC